MLNATGHFTMSKRSLFFVYRYQIIPISRSMQGTLFEKNHTLEELLGSKNQIFEDALTSISSFSTERTEVNHRVVFENDHFFLYRVAVSRRLDRETKDFRREPVENWPSFLIGIWNAPDRQFIAIEKRFEAFQTPETMVRHIVELLNERLLRSNLRVHWEALFEQNAFWELVTQYEGKIQELMFNLVTPNMANISGTLPEELKVLAKDSNAATTVVKLEADPASALTVSKKNPDVRGLVDYASRGGGEITIRVRGIRRKIRTAKSSTTVEISEVEASDPTIAANLLKNLLGDK